MTRYAAVAFCAFVLAGCTLPPCPEGQARDNNRQCVAVAQPLPAGFVADKPAEPNVFDQFDGQAPSKDEFIEASNDGMVLPDEAIARINADRARQADDAMAEYERKQAQRRADARTDRIVDAERETQAELRRIGNKLD